MNGIEETVVMTVDQLDDRLKEMNMHQPQLIEIDFDQVEEYQIGITGAGALEGGDDLQIGQGVTIEVTGDVVAIHVTKRTRPEKEGGGEYIVRKAVIKAERAKVSKLKHSGI